jgi:hypothetical protein
MATMATERKQYRALIRARNKALSRVTESLVIASGSRPCAYCTIVYPCDQLTPGLRICPNCHDTFFPRTPKGHRAKRKRDPKELPPMRRSAGKERRLELLCERDGWFCHLCGAPVSMDAQGYDFLTLDHIVPRSRGGRNSIDNLAPAHYRCNNQRGNAPLTPRSA